VKGYNAMNFLMIRKLFQLSLKVLPESVVKLSYASKSVYFLILLLSAPLGQVKGPGWSSGSSFLQAILKKCEVKRCLKRY
jgi:hypothetical protein